VGTHTRHQHLGGAACTTGKCRRRGARLGREGARRVGVPRSKQPKPISEETRGPQSGRSTAAHTGGAKSPDKKAGPDPLSANGSAGVGAGGAGGRPGGLLSDPVPLGRCKTD
jgi:hypothetical protein